MDPNKTTIIYGPPGTGKTTRLLSIVEEKLAQRVCPQEICYAAFTRRAAYEAKDRASEAFGLDPDTLPMFRTLHSLAFTHLGLNIKQVMGTNDYLKLAQALGLYITLNHEGEDGFIPGQSHGDRLFFREAMARSRMMPLKEYWEMIPDEDLQYYELERVAKAIELYKKSTGKLDFIDMIYRFLEDDSLPRPKILIVDEAQDLSPLQWKMIETLASTASEVYIAGDDDQAIYVWAGANVEIFMGLNGHKEVLSQSYRCPGEVYKLANTIASRITNRINKPYLPTNLIGQVHYVTNIDQIDMSKGKWLVLARNLYLLEHINRHCITNGWIFDSQIGSPIRSKSLQATVSWEALRAGKSILASEVKNIYSLLTTRIGCAHGAKKLLDAVPDDQLLSLQDLKDKYGLLVQSVWHEALDKMPDIEREYFLAARRNGEKLLATPRIRISTIHAAKGSEADNVVVLTDMAQRTWQEFQNNPDDEHRVWYVGITRAREQLFIVNSPHGLFYDV